MRCPSDNAYHGPGGVIGKAGLRYFALCELLESFIGLLKSAIVDQFLLDEVIEISRRCLRLDLDKLDLSEFGAFKMTLPDQVVDAVHRVDFGLVPYREPHFALPVLDLEPVARSSSNPAVRERAGDENAAELMQLGYQTGAVIGSIEFAARRILETIE